MIKLLENGNVDMGLIEIEDIVNISLLQKFQDNFAISINCASVTVDRKGNPVTKPSSYTQFCEGFIHKSHIGDERCAASHQRMGVEAAKSGRPFIGPCHAGLIDFAAPVIVNDELIGTVLGGQVLSDKPNEEDCRKIAKEIGISEGDLVEAEKKIKITGKENIKAAAEVLFIVVNTLAQNGYTRVKLETIAKQLANRFVEISGTLEELVSSAQSISDEQIKLDQQIVQIGKFNEEINLVLDSINQIARNTQILGINSLIEAAHAGEVGKGFAVVAKEIKNLSENSKVMAHDILQLTEKIKESIDTTVSYSKITLGTTKEQTKAMEDVSNAVQEIVYLTDVLDNMMRENQIID